ncbi:reverse transcriptase domain-containing protein [Tanacetum coccineum]
MELRILSLADSFPNLFLTDSSEKICAFSQNENESLVDAWLRMHGNGSEIAMVIILQVLQSRAKQPTPDHDDDDMPMSREEEVKFMQIFAENMLIEVGKFTFPANFIIPEMKEDNKVPLILGRPFLHTADAVIRVKHKQLNLGVGTERKIFNIDSAMKHSYSNVIVFLVARYEGSKILHSIEGTLLKEEILFEFDEFMAMTADENSKSESDIEEHIRENHHQHRL